MSTARSLHRRGKPASEPPTGGGVAVLPCLAAAFAVFLAFLPAIRFGFVMDDDKQLPALYRPPPGIRLTQAASPLKFREKRTHPSPYFRPLGSLAFLAGEAFSGKNPWGYHLVLLLLHASAAFLAGLVGVKLLGERAGIATVLLFGLHPVHVPSASWISETPAVLMAALALLAFLFHLRRRPFPAAAALFAAVLSHEGALVAPFLFAAHDAAGRRIGERRPRRLFSYTLYAVALAASLILRFFWGKGFQLPGEGGQTDFRAALALLGYLQASLWLPFSSGDWVRGDLLPWTYVTVGVGGPVVLFLSFFFLRGRRSVVVFRALLWSLVPLLPLLAVRGAEEVEFARRYLYLSALAPSLLAAWGVSALSERLGRPGAAWGGVLILSAALLPLSLGQSRIWKNEKTLWAAAARRNPEHPVPRHGYAAMLGRAGDFGGAYREGTAALDLIRRGRGDRKLEGEVHLTLAMAQRRRGRTASALRHLARARECDPRAVLYPMQEGNLYEEQGEPEKAAESFGEAARLAPDDPEIRVRLGAALLEAGRAEEAREELEKALRLDPTDPTPHYYLGYLFEAVGKMNEARAVWRAYLEKAGDRPNHSRWREIVRGKLSDHGE